MATRRGEKIGWTAGWLGGFLWVAALSFLFLFQGKFLPGITGLALFGLAAAAIVALAPWRHPATPYWKLMLLPYALFLASAAWAVWSWGGPGGAGFHAWNGLWILPALIPLGSAGRRKWADGEVGPDREGAR